MNKYVLLVLLFCLSILLTIHPLNGQMGAVEKYLELESSYQKRSTEELRLFFDEWENNSTTISNQDLEKLPAYLQLAYSFFKFFYIPSEYNTDYHKEGIIYPNYYEKEYLVLQSRIIIQRLNIAGCDTFYSKYMSSIDTVKFDTLCTINNFYPQIKQTDFKTLYLNDYYETVLDSFTQKPIINIPTMSYPFTSSADSLEYVIRKNDFIGRRDYLSPYIGLAHSHWGRKWWYYSFPYIQFMVFTKDYKYLWVMIRTSYGSGEELIYKYDGNWYLVENWGRWTE